MVFTIGIALSDPLSADVHKWVDEQGRVHYGDKPPAGAVTKVLPPPPSVDREDAARQRERLEQAEREMEVRMDKRREKATAKEVEKQERTSARERCLALRRELDVLDSGAPVYRDEQGRFRVKWLYDSYQGRRRYLEESERSLELTRVRVEVSTHCGDPDDPAARRLARKQQVRAEHCEAKRADLESMMRRSVPVSDETLEAQRHQVSLYCDE